MTDYKDGDVIQVNGKPCRIEGGALVPVVKHGPLGGELKTWEQLRPGESGYLIITKGMFNQDMDRQAFEGFKETVEKANIETNIPPRPTFSPMSAGEAAALPDIVGRWVAVQVEKTDGYELVLGDEKYERWFDRDDQILLIEGVALP